MQLAPFKQTIEVSAPAIALQTDTTGVATTIDAKAINDLPLNGRTFAQLATLVPGVAPQVSVNIATNRKRGSIGTAFAITASGFSDVQNSFVYDGVPAMDWTATISRSRHRSTRSGSSASRPAPTRAPTAARPAHTWTSPPSRARTRFTARPGSSTGTTRSPRATTSAPPSPG
jgi:hypothetical protein